MDPSLYIGATVVVNDKKGEMEHLSMEYWRERVLLSESLEEQVSEKDETISLLKTKLASCEEAKVRFAATADLAATRVKELRSNLSSEIVDS